AALRIQCLSGGNVPAVAAESTSRAARALAFFVPRLPSAKLLTQAPGERRFCSLLGRPSRYTKSRPFGAATRIRGASMTKNADVRPGISGMSLYVPSFRVSLEAWCQWTGNPWEKVRNVVGRSFRVPGRHENVYTMAANAVLRLI